MKSKIENFEQLASKIRNINFTAKDGYSFTGDHWKISFRFEPNESKTMLKSVPVNVVISLRYKDSHILSWGNDSHESTIEMVKLYHEINNIVRTKENKQREQNEKEAFLAFEML